MYKLSETSFSFIRDIIAATLGVEMHHLVPPYPNEDTLDYRLSLILKSDFDYHDLFNTNALSEMESGTIYFIHNTLKLNYAIFPLSDISRGEFLMFGPFLYETPNGDFFERILAKNHIGKNDAAALQIFYSTVPVVPEPIMAASAYSIACELYGTFDTSRIMHRNLDSVVVGNSQPDESLQFSMDVLERRYRDENALLTAISHGDYDAAVRHLRHFASFNILPRSNDILRDHKNMLIILNTLMRKATEKGGVHPVYLDRLSGAFAVKIEQTTDSVAAKCLALDMLRRYCQLVQNNSHRGYSLVVQRTLNYINLHLSDELSLASIAGALGFNAAYLSAQFSRECRETLTNYVHTVRLEAACRMLDETDLSVSEIASRIGIEDAAYFSRLFRKKYGVSPQQYRTRALETHLLK